MATKEYPVLPLRNTVLFPTTVVPINIGRPKSVALLEAVVEADKMPFVLISQRQLDTIEPGIEDLYDVGTVAEVKKVMTQGDAYTAIVQGQQRVRMLSMSFDEDKGYFVGTFEPVEEIRSHDEEEDALIQTLKETAIEVIENSKEIPSESVQMVQSKMDPSEITDFIISSTELDVPSKQEFLSESDINVRLEKCIAVMSQQIQASRVQAEVQQQVRAEADKTQKEYYLRQQLKAIKEQLGTYDDEVEELEVRIAEAGMPVEAYEAAMKQFNRLAGMQPSSSEYSVILNYLETLIDVPWKTRSEDNLNLERAQEILDDDHYGLDKVKKRIIEYLAVRGLKDDMKGPILCLHGPPGVGKTSLGRSIARTLGRKFQRISLGGVHDESEIRGHRRTYVGALPGRLVQALTKAGTNNPVILLDEIDKVSRDFRGDPSAALLEVLDPEQNHAFNDHYLEVDLDLSKVLFIATANQLDTVSPPLRDRMEIIDVPSYTLYEKQQIAQKYLVPKQVEAHGISDSNVEFPVESVKYVIDKYTREAGVRNLERRMADLCRNVAVEVAKTDPEDRADIHVVVDEPFVQDALGPERYISEMAQRVNMVGVATGLAWTQAGGDILFIEAQQMPGKGELKLTGQLGDVMKESVHAALSYIRAHSKQLKVDADLGERKQDLHIHVPAGAIPKDGPSAGITMFTALLSRLSDRKVRKDVAMTGEITLSGNVLPVGGIKEKVIAAHRAGIKTIIMPAICEKDLVDVESDVRNDLSFHFVDDVEELLPLVFESEAEEEPVG